MASELRQECVQLAKVLVWVEAPSHIVGPLWNHQLVVPHLTELLQLVHVTLGNQLVPLRLDEQHRLPDARHQLVGVPLVGQQHPQAELDRDDGCPGDQANHHVVNGCKGVLQNYAFDPRPVLFLRAGVDCSRPPQASAEHHNWESPLLPQLESPLEDGHAVLFQPAFGWSALAVRVASIGHQQHIRRSLFAEVFHERQSGSDVYVSVQLLPAFS